MRKWIGLLAATVSLGSAHAAEPLWHWIWVVPAPDPTKGWTTFEGVAPVTFNGTTLRANLDGKVAGWEPALEVKGEIKGKIVRAVVSRPGADAGPERYDGSLIRWRSKQTDPSGGWGEDRIWLHAGPAYLGLYRQVPPTK